MRVIYFPVRENAYSTNRYRIVPTMRLDEALAIKRLTRLTLTEIALGVLALLLVSAFAMLEPNKFSVAADMSLAGLL